MGGGIDGVSVVCVVLVLVVVGAAGRIVPVIAAWV